MVEPISCNLAFRIARRAWRRLLIGWILPQKGRGGQHKPNMEGLYCSWGMVVGCVVQQRLGELTGSLPIVLAQYFNRLTSAQASQSGCRLENYKNQSLGPKEFEPLFAPPQPVSINILVWRSFATRRHPIDNADGVETNTRIVRQPPVFLESLRSRSTSSEKSQKTGALAERPAQNGAVKKRNSRRFFFGPPQAWQFAAPGPSISESPPIGPICPCKTTTVS